MSPTLFAIAAELAQILDCEELPTDLEAQLDALAIAFPAKVDNCCRMIQEMRGHAVRFKDEAERLADIADRYARDADRLKAYVRDAMLTVGMRTLETEWFRLRVQANPPSVDCVGDAPPQFEITVGTSLRGVS